LFYTPEVKATIDFIIETCPKEVGWLGLVEKMGDDYRVYKIYVPEQTVTGAETNINTDAMTALTMEVLNAGFDSSELYYWGHSHVNMAVSPSNQDEEQVAEYLENTPVFIRGIYNKAGDSKVDIYDVKAGVIHECVWNGLLANVLTNESKAAMVKLLTANVKARVYAQSVAYDGRGNSWDVGKNQKLNGKPKSGGHNDFLYQDLYDDDEWAELNSPFASEKPLNKF
jgi:hypothetical protein